MAGSPSEDSGIGGSSTVIQNGQSCQTGEALTEWRSSEQVENGTPSTSPSYWDAYDDDDCEQKPSELYGKFTWKIEKFPEISKRELRSNAFEVGGYKWYILIYPQGCDVCNHLSLFLCVANHDKLLPGWSHFAQFTIAVVNKDPKKSKYSDTLHRFWKKEHDWGWKKFMELAKVQDGFIVDDTLVIKAQVQVIREKLHRPFRCLDNQYRRELVRVYLTNVEQICRRFVEEKRGKLGKLIEDKLRWSSFCEYWLKVDKDVRIHMSREKTDVILKVVVKHFFIEKEVTSTLVMDSLYSGLKALTQEAADPIVCVEKDMFLLADDVISLLERASLEPLPPKDEKGPQNRTKDGNSGEECNKDSIEPDERRLTELGRRSVEIFVLSHIFSNKIEIAYQNAIALEKQEELIREEANSKTGRAESEHKSRRGATEKEKRAKKKQSKQRRSSRKAKDKGKDEKFGVEVLDDKPNGPLVDVGTKDDSSVIQVLTMHENPEALDDVSDVSFNGDDTIEALRPDVEDRYASPLTSDTETSEVHQIDTIEAQPSIEISSSGICGLPVQNGRTSNTTNSVRDDSSSTCSTDSVPSEPVNGSYKGNSMLSYKMQMSPKRGEKQHGKQRHDQTSSAPDLDILLLEPVMDVVRLHDVSGTCETAEPELEVDVLSKKDQTRLEPNMDQKVEHKIVTPQKKLIVNNLDDDKPFFKQMVKASSSPARNLPSMVQSKSMGKSGAAAAEPLTDETSSKKNQEPERKFPANIVAQAPVISKLDVRRSATVSKPEFTLKEKVTTHVLSGLSVPSSTPIIPASRPSSPMPSMVQTTPQLSRSVSATGRLGSDSSAATHSYAPSYRNAIMGKTLGGNPTGFTPYPSSSSGSPSPTYLQSMSASLSSLMHPPQRSGGNDQSLARPGFTFGSVSPEVLQNRPQWLDYPQHDSSMYLQPSELNGNQNLDFYGSPRRVSPTYFGDDFPASVSGRASSRQAQGVVPDEFPHLDIINYLLDEDHSIGKPRLASRVSSSYNMHDHPLQHSFNRQFSLPREVTMSSDASSSNYCRFDLLDNIHGNGMHPFYGSSGGNYSGLMDAVPMVGQQIYGTGHLDGVTRNHWPYGGTADISLLNIRNNEGDGYPYQLPEYTSLTNGVSGYTSYRPSHGR